MASEDGATNIALERVIAEAANRMNRRMVKPPFLFFQDDGVIPATADHVDNKSGGLVFCDWVKKLYFHAQLRSTTMCGARGERGLNPSLHCVRRKSAGHCPEVAFTTAGSIHGQKKMSISVESV